jgi:hypothetical protein
MKNTFLFHLSQTPDNGALRLYWRLRFRLQPTLGTAAGAFIGTAAAGVDLGTLFCAAAGVAAGTLFGTAAGGYRKYA